MNVKAYHIARGIDITKARNVYGQSPDHFHKKSFTITLDAESNQHISVFKYGSVVLFNVPEGQHPEELRKITELAAVSPIAEGLQQTETYKIIIHERLENPSIIKAGWFTKEFVPIVFA